MFVHLTSSLDCSAFAAILQGLGEVYESEYVQQATGFTAPDKAEPLRRQAVALFRILCGKLDALSSFAFTPKPVVEELEVRLCSDCGVRVLLTCHTSRQRNMF